MTNAISSFGTLVKVGDGATPTEAFTTIAEVQDIQLPQMTRDTEDVTHHSSPGAWEEAIATILRSGEVTFDVNWIYDDPTHDHTDGILSLLVSGAATNFRFVLPSGGTDGLQVKAMVTGFSPNAPVAGKLGASITLKPTGQPLFVLPA